MPLGRDLGQPYAAIEVVDRVGGSPSGLPQRYTSAHGDHSARPGRLNDMDLELEDRRALVSIPAGRYGDATEFASVIAFLASPRASYLTGGVIRVDGGMIRSV